MRGIDLLYNTGQQRTSICRLEHAHGEYVIMMDDDLQNPPEEIPKLIEVIQSEPAPDCVMASYEKKQHNLILNLGSRTWRYMAANLYNVPTNLRLTSFRILNRDLVDMMCSFGTARPVVGPLIARSTRRVANVSINHQPRVAGESGFRLSRLVKMVLDSVFNASILPLRIVSLLGLCAAADSTLLAAYYLISYFVGRISVLEFMTQVIVISFLGA